MICTHSDDSDRYHESILWYQVECMIVEETRCYYKKCFECSMVKKVTIVTHFVYFSSSLIIQD